MSEPDVLPPKTQSSFLWRVLKWTLILTVGGLLFAFVALNLLLAPYIKHKLEKAVRQGSAGLYTLHIDGMRVYFWQGSVVAEGIAFEQDSSYREWMRKNGQDPGHSKLSFKTPVITVKNIRWREYLKNDIIRVGEVYVDFPQLTLARDVRQPRRVKPLHQRKNPGDTLQAPIFERLPELIGHLAKGLQIDTLAFNQGKLAHQLVNQLGTARHEADSISISLRDIRIDSSSRSEAWYRVLYAKEVRFGLRNYRYTGAEGIYRMTIKRIQSPDLNSLLIDSLDLRTLVSDEEFVRRHAYAKDRFAVLVPRITCRELDIERFLRNDWVAQSVHLYQPLVNMYRDKRPPRDPSPRQMPHETVRELPFYFKVDTIQFHEIRLQYAEKAPGADQTGDVVLEKTNLRVLNLSNDPAYMADASPAVVQMDTRLMGQGQLAVTLQMNLLGDRFDCQYNGSLRRMNMGDFNRFFLPSANIQIEDGQIEKVIFAVKVKHGVASGHLKALYRNLKLGVLHREKKKERKLLSFLGNLLIRSNNRYGSNELPEIGTISYQRLSDDGFVRFLWRAVKTGLLTTLMPEGLARAANQQANAPPKAKEAVKSRKKANKPENKKERRKIRLFGKRKSEKE